MNETYSDNYIIILTNYFFKRKSINRQNELQIFFKSPPKPIKAYLFTGNMDTAPIGDQAAKGAGRLAGARQWVA